MSARAAGIEGIALWAPCLPGWEAAAPALCGEAPAQPAAATRPVPALLPPNERRRASDTVALSLHVAEAACTHAGRDPAALRCVFASTHGDMATTDYMCQTLATDPRLLSPTRFHNSVHNAAAGYWTIATGCMQPYTALSAGRHTFAEGLLEALVQAECEAAPVLYVAYDVEARGPLAGVAPSRGWLGAALVLAPLRLAAASGWAMRWQLGEDPAPRDPEPDARNAAYAAGNAMAACLPLFEALAGARGGRLQYALGPHALLELEVQRR